jgi:hypothetical protein
MKMSERRCRAVPQHIYDLPNAEIGLIKVDDEPNHSSVGIAAYFFFFFFFFFLSHFT